MAYVHTLRNEAGEPTSYRVRWRLGGARSGKGESERFDDQESADLFKELVNKHHQQWPPGWVKGRGFIAEDTPDEAEFAFRAFALGCIEHRTGIEERYRDDCMRELRTYILPTFGNCDVRSTEHFSKRTVQQWVNAMAGTYVMRGSVRKLMSPKTLKNLHGLLSSILTEAVEHEPPLRDRNPCKLVALPRLDDDGIEDDDGEDIEFLEPHEVEGIVSCLTRPEDQRLVRFKYATGLRWGELTSLAHRHAVTDANGHRRIRVTRAWKRNKARGYYLGKPKTKASRRSIRVSSLAWQDLLDQGVKPDPRRQSSRARGAGTTEGAAPAAGARNELVFHNGSGERLPYSTFYDRWMRAVRLAKERELLPEWKHPTLHDLRHSHAAALISAGHPLSYVKERLGHESITTTDGVYGHLLPKADDDAMATIDGSLGGPTEAAGALALAEDVGDGELPDEEQLNVRKVYVMHLVDGTVQGWWKRSDRDLVAEMYAIDQGGMPAVETWSADWWIRQHGNGEKDVRREPAERVRVWCMGPAVYSGDGVLVDPKADYEPVARPVWEWEAQYTEEPAVSRVEWREGGTETEAEVWGVSRSEVIAAFSRAAIMALQVCGLNPALAGGGDGQGGAGVPAGQTDS